MINEALIKYSTPDITVKTLKEITVPDVELMKY